MNISHSQSITSPVLRLYALHIHNTIFAQVSGLKKEKSPIIGDFLQFGSFLLSRSKMSSIIGEEELNYRVRNGVGCTLFSMAAKISKYIIDRNESRFFVNKSHGQLVLVSYIPHRTYTSSLSTR